MAGWRCCQGGGLLYGIAYANTGAVTATNVKITETVPTNTRFVLARSALGWSCANNSPAGSACTLSLGTLAAGARGSAVFAGGAETTYRVAVIITNTVQHPPRSTANPTGSIASVGTPLVLTGGSDITPLLECVIDRGSAANPRYAAVSGYNNPNAFAKVIAVGSSNAFAPTPIDRSQTTLFMPGRQRNAFAVDFNTGALTWTLNGKTTVASTSATRCANTLKIISGVAWLDSNGNGLRGSTLLEPGLPLIFVNLLDQSGAVSTGG